MNVVFLGPPGAGKGTQAQRVSKRLGIPHVSTGEIFRAAIAAGSELGKQVERVIASGQLVPDTLTNEIVRERLSQPDAAQGAMLDGYPRSVAQAQFLAQIGWATTAVVNIAVPDDVLVRRLSGRRVCAACKAIDHVETAPDGICRTCGGKLTQRADDAPESVSQRLVVYHEVTAPLEDWYSANGNLLTIDGSLDIDAVTEAILAALECGA